MKKIFAVILCFTMMIPFIVTAGALSETNGFLYEGLDSFHAEIVGIRANSELSQAESIVIPDYVRELAVTQIGQSAFLQNNTVQYITMPESTRQISDSAMYGMKSLKTITIPKNTETLGKSVFAYCTALESVNFNTTSLSAIPEFTFYGCTNLNNVILPDGTVTIGNLAFARCTGMDKIYIPSSVEHISDTAFDNISGLTIYGEINSEVYRYAQENNINFTDMSGKDLESFSESMETAFYLIHYTATSVYTEETFNTLSVAYDNAVIVKNNFFSTQNEINTAKSELDNAYYSLRLKSMDTLDELIIRAENEMENSFCYTENSVNALEEAINQSKNIQNAVLPSVTQVQNAINNLNSNISGLIEVVKYDVNFDGRISLADIVTVHKKLISDEIFTQRDIYIADFNSDNRITLSDIVLFQRHLLTR